jgi:hypothetical protein
MTMVAGQTVVGSLLLALLLSSTIFQFLMLVDCSALFAIDLSQVPCQD